ncbi:hypothetical protein K438DRAFT_1948900 [Mycena galopus ATCC 62051]|nr:hypothetical protein K438DRAFT_1948900 [Mycena galopus ATCC 62051]
MAGLLDLPTELLIDILENPTFPTETLYALSLLCRRLHFIALPIFLSRHGFAPDSIAVTIQIREDGRDLLAALQSSLLPTQPQSLTCVFPHPSCTSIFPLLPHIERLEKYISCLPSVQHVTLELDTWGSVCLAVGDDRALRAWAIDMESLLNCIVEKQCASLAIRHGGQFSRAYEVAPGGVNQRLTSIRRLFSAVPKLFLRTKVSETQRFSRAPHQGTGRIEMGACRRSPKLTSLDIRSAAFFLPPGLNWTLTALRNCRIQSLTLSRSVEDATTWSTVLPLIASAGRGLISLTLIDADHLSDGEYLDFIAQLPRLRHLSVDSRRQVEIRESCALIPLRTLETLRAPPRLIEHLVHHPSPLPKITSICILWPKFYVATEIGALRHGRRRYLDGVVSHVRRVDLTVSFSADLDLPRLLRAIEATEFVGKLGVNGKMYELVKEGTTMCAHHVDGGPGIEGGVVARGMDCAAPRKGG